MNKDKLLPLLGLAQKAGRVQSGYNLVRSYLEGRKKRPALIIISEDISDNSKDYFLDKGHKLNIPVFQACSRQELGKAIGKVERAIVAIMDQNFARELHKILAGEES